LNDAHPWAPKPRNKLRTVLPFAVFVFFLGLWTWELLAEKPVPDSVMRLIPVAWRFWLAKGLHVAGYAFLTVLAAMLPVNRMYFWIVIGGLVVHGLATELGQTFVNGRTGSFRDVLLDWAGIGLGVAVVLVFDQIRSSGGRNRRR
jgi:VanZ family protein